MLPIFIKNTITYLSPSVISLTEWKSRFVNISSSPGSCIIHVPSSNFIPPPSNELFNAIDTVKFDSSL